MEAAVGGSSIVNTRTSHKEMCASSQNTAALSHEGIS